MWCSDDDLDVFGVGKSGTEVGFEVEGRKKRRGEPRSVFVLPLPRDKQIVEMPRFRSFREVGEVRLRGRVGWMDRRKGCGMIWCPALRHARCGGEVWCRVDHLDVFGVGKGGTEGVF